MQHLVKLKGHLGNVVWRRFSEGFRPSTFSKIEVSEHAPLVECYLSHGFIIRGSLVRGSVALLPRGMFNWKVKQ